MGREFDDAAVLEIARAYEAVTPWSSLVPLQELPANRILGRIPERSPLA
jgi:Asp-tRNA(Asn)/Glu-tRNA(Gln) amidotransferase A subunit family amidase